MTRYTLSTKFTLLRNTYLKKNPNSSSTTKRKKKIPSLRPALYSYTVFYIELKGCFRRKRDLFNRKLFIKFQHVPFVSSQYTFPLHLFSVDPLLCAMDFFFLQGHDPDIHPTNNIKAFRGSVGYRGWYYRLGKLNPSYTGCLTMSH